MEKILATANCPNCKGKINARNIFVEYATERTCSFRISCDKCKGNAIVQAVISVEPKNKDQQISSLEPISPPKISENEVLEIGKFFEENKGKSFSSFFTKS